MTAPLLLHVFPSFAVGGAQVRFCAVANRFGPRWRHAIVSLDGRWDCAARLAPDAEVTRVESPSMAGGLPRRIRAIRRSLQTLRPDLLITSNWGSIEWAIANRVTSQLPHLHTEDGFGPEESTGQLFRRVLTRRIALRRSELVLPSDLLVRMARNTWRLPAERLHRVVNGLDLGRFAPGEALRSDEACVIGTVAALRREKNVGRLLRAVARLRKEGAALRLMIVGDGPERAALQALAQDLGIAAIVEFLGHVEDPAPIYRLFDVYALSSDTEQMPFSVLEAMASGLPVVATEVGDLRAMLPELSQQLIVPRDDGAMAEALRPLVTSADLRARLGAANRAKAVRDYDQEQMFQSFAQLFDRLVAQRGTRWRVRRPDAMQANS